MESNGATGLARRAEFTPRRVRFNNRDHDETEIGGGAQPTQVEILQAALEEAETRAARAETQLQNSTLENHSPVMAMLRAGTLTVENDGTSQSFEIDGGFVDVTPEGVTVLAETISQA